MWPTLLSCEGEGTVKNTRLAGCFGCAGGRVVVAAGRPLGDSPKAAPGEPGSAGALSTLAVRAQACGSGHLLRGAFSGCFLRKPTLFPGISLPAQRLQVEPSSPAVPPATLWKQGLRLISGQGCTTTALGDAPGVCKVQLEVLVHPDISSNPVGGLRAVWRLSKFQNVGESLTGPAEYKSPMGRLELRVVDPLEKSCRMRLPRTPSGSRSASWRVRPSVGPHPGGQDGDHGRAENGVAVCLRRPLWDAVGGVTPASHEAEKRQGRPGSGRGGGPPPASVPGTAPPPRTGAPAGLGRPVPAQGDPRALCPAARHPLPSGLCCDAFGRKLST